MKLPPRIGGEALTLPAGARQITIIGANGSGKTRFTEAMQKSLGEERVFRLSALNAVSEQPPQSGRADIDSCYLSAIQSPGFLQANDFTMFDRLMTLLLNEEMLALVAFKVASVRGEQVALPHSKLDAVIERWQELFPDNHVLREGGSILFSRIGTADKYSQRRLSHGEKAVLFYLGAVLYAPEKSVIFVDSPGMFLHNSLLRRVWDTVEELRPDCRFVYTTHDVDFAASRSENSTLWIRAYDPDTSSWNYDLLPANTGLSEEVTIALVGERRPVLFIEGDAIHSIDAKLYPLVFREYSVKSLGSCNKVIESTRAFNDLRVFHHLESRGIVDRDRRDAAEVDYLRGKNIFVPDVAEIENILMLEDVIKMVAKSRGKNPDSVFAAVRSAVVKLFRADLQQQALLHTRHRVKRTMEYRIDRRFTDIDALEDHMVNLVNEINPRNLYEKLCRQFSQFANSGDYASILRVYNQKSMVPRSNVSQLCGLNGSKDAYVQAVLAILKSRTPEAKVVRSAIRSCFGLDNTNVSRNLNTSAKEL